MISIVVSWAILSSKLNGISVESEGCRIPAGLLPVPVKQKFYS
jgi:hypothetical protein